MMDRSNDSSSEYRAGPAAGGAGAGGAGAGAGAGTAAAATAAEYEPLGAAICHDEAMWRVAGDRNP